MDTALEKPATLRLYEDALPGALFGGFHHEVEL